MRTPPVLGAKVAPKNPRLDRIVRNAISPKRPQVADLNKVLREQDSFGYRTPIINSLSANYSGGKVRRG